MRKLTTSIADRIPCKKLYKLAVVGAGGVGKSTLIARLVTGEFLDKTMTVGFDVESWTVQEDDTGCIKVALFDFGGQKQFRFFQGSLIIGSKVALVVFDCCSYRSLMQDFGDNIRCTGNPYDYQPEYQQVNKGKFVIFCCCAVKVTLSAEERCCSSLGGCLQGECSPQETQ